MIGLVLGIGDEWYECAEWAAARMAKCTGLHCEVVTYGTGMCHPSWEKCRLPDRYPGEDLLIFDADLIPQVHWDPHDWLKPGTIAMCPDQMSHPQVRTECKEWGIEGVYCNGGLMLVHRDCDVLSLAAQRHPACGRWLEQTAINVEAQGRLVEMPSLLNTLIRSQVLKTYKNCNPHFVSADVAHVRKMQKWLTRS